MSTFGDGAPPLPFVRRGVAQCTPALRQEHSGALLTFRDRDRPKPGGSCSATERPPRPALGGAVVPIQGAICHRGSDLQHQMGPSRRPTHLLVRAHPAMQQPLHRALSGRRRDRLVAVPRRRIVDDQGGLSGHVCLKATQQSSHLARRLARRRGRRRGSNRVKSHQRIAREIECPLDLTVPQTPANVLDGVSKAGAFPTIVIRDIRPALHRLGNMLNPHRQMKPIKYVTSRTDTRRLSQRSRPVGTIAQDGGLRAWCRAKAMHYAAQLLDLPIGLDRNAAEGDPLAVIVAGLCDEHLEGSRLVAANCTHVTGVDGQRDRLRLCRRRCRMVSIVGGSSTGKKSSSKVRARR